MFRSFKNLSKKLIRKIADVSSLESAVRANEAKIKANEAELKTNKAELTKSFEGLKDINSRMIFLEEAQRILQDKLRDANKKILDNESTHKDLVNQLEVKIGSLERNLRRSANIDLTIVDKSVKKDKLIKKIKSDQLSLLQFDYLGFEDCFRGSEELIKQRQSIYLKYFKNKKKVLDIGCGRGEFLQVLEEANIKNSGIDLDLDMVLYCKEKGLDVKQAEGLSYLSDIKDSLGGIFLGQVVEHLSLEYLNELFNLCYSKLEDKGVLIVETVNPHCDQAMKWFYLDPTHNKPVFPEFLTYLARSKGFTKTKIEYLTPIVEKNKSDRTLFGDYALIAIKES